VDVNNTHYVAHQLQLYLRNGEQARLSLGVRGGMFANRYGARTDHALAGEAWIGYRLAGFEARTFVFLGSRDSSDPLLDFGSRGFGVVLATGTL
jgi:hypothetical protein